MDALAKSSGRNRGSVVLRIKAGELRRRMDARGLAQALGERGRSAAGNASAVGFMQRENLGADSGKIVRIKGDVEPRDADDSGKALQRRMRLRCGPDRIVAVGHGIKRFRIREREFGGMQVVGERNGREKKRQDANQSDEALPFPVIRGAFTKLRQPSQAPHEREGDGNRQPDRVEEKLHVALILEQESAQGNRGGASERLDD